MAPGFTLAVVLAAAPANSGRLAVLGLASSDGAAAPSSAPLAAALTSRGVDVIDGVALRARLVGDAKPLAHELSQTVIQGIAAAGAAYDRGEFAESARRAGQAVEALLRAAPSLQRELSINEAQLLWGAALLQLKGRAAAIAHFGIALQRDPSLTLDKERFAPPVQRVLEDERIRIAKGPKVTLTVAGIAGATLFVDGVARGSLPASISLTPHRATVWVEAGGRPGLVHELDVSRSTWLTIDWQLEAAAHFSPVDWQIELPSSDALRRALLQRFLGQAGADGLIGVRWLVAPGDPAAARHLEVVCFASDGTEQDRRVLPPEGIDWNRLARSLQEAPISPARTLERPVSVTEAAAEAPVGAAGVPTARTGRFPWLAAGLIAGGVAVVAVVVVVALSVHPTNAVLLGPETPHP